MDTKQALIPLKEQFRRNRVAICFLTFFLFQICFYVFFDGFLGGSTRSEETDHTTTRLFLMDDYTYDLDWRKGWLEKGRRMASSVASPVCSSSSNDCNCTLIGVVSSIKANISVIPSFLNRFPGSRIVVVGDEDFVISEELSSRVQFLSLEIQRQLYPELSNALPHRSFSRKNIGYAHALAMGACYIWDFEDDIEAQQVVALEKTLQGSKLEASMLLGVLTTSKKEPLVNPYLLFGPERDAWPRGYPLEFTRNQSSFPYLQSTKARNVADWSIDVVQVLQEESPDVDAIWRLKNPLPLRWNPPEALQKGEVIIGIDPSVFAPFNAQSTIVSRRAAFMLYLPHTVHGRVSDIWRSFLAQAILPSMKGLLAFSAPHVRHGLQSRSSLADLDAEVPLYTRSEVLVEFLSKWRQSQLQQSTGTFVDGLNHMIELYVEVTSRGLLDKKAEEELKGLVAWVQTLRKIHFHSTFPVAITPQHLEPTTITPLPVLAAVHMNHQRWTNAPLWKAIHPELEETLFYTPGTSPCPSSSGLNFQCISNDFRGYYAYESLFHATQLQPYHQFYLFTHDDVVVQSPQLNWFITEGKTVSCSKAGKFSSNSNWSWNQMILSSSKELSTRWNSSRLCSGGAGQDSTFTGFEGQSDWWLIRAEDVKLTIFDFEEHRAVQMFLEFTVPTLLACNVPNRTTTELMTDWGPERTNSKLQSDRFCSSKDHQLIHPLKISSIDGVRAFIQARECVK